MNKLLLTLLIAIFFVTGCSTMTPARYAVSVDNNQALKSYAGSSVQLAQLSPPANYDAACRLMGPIQAADGMTIPAFIQKAFNDEFKFADIYSANGTQLTGSVDKIEFSSISGLTNGWWELAITLKAPNGKSVSSESRTEFKSGYDAVTACNQTAQALGGAVQDLIQKTVTAPGFADLLR